MTRTRAGGPARQHWFDRSLLTDPSRCPGCAAPLRGPSCHACGLSLAGQAGADLWDVSRRAAVLLDARDSLLTTLHRAATVPTPAQAPVPVPVPVPVPLAGPVPEARPAPAPGPWQMPALPAYPRQDATVPHPGPAAGPLTARVTHPLPQPPAAPRASWPLQNLLLGLGALLLAGASIVFLAFTWGAMPLALRATVIAVITAAVFGAATLARRKGLSSSADAISALGSLLVVLDAWALHATGLVEQPDGATFAALAVLGSAGVLVALGTVFRLDVARAAGCVLLPVAPVLLSIDAPSVSLATLLVVLAVVTCGIQFASSCERRAAPVLRVLALVLLVLALVLTAVALLLDGLFAAAGVLVVIAIVTHGWSWFLRPPVVVWPIAAGSTQTLAAVCAALALTGDAPSASWLWVGPLGALAGAASVVLVSRLLPRLSPKVPAAAWFVFFATTAAPVQSVVVLTLAAVTMASPVSDQPVVWAALAGLVVALGGSVAHASVSRTRPRETATTLVPAGPALRVTPWFAALVLLGGALLLPGLSALVVYWLVVPLAIVSILDRRLPRGWSTALRAACFTAVAHAIVLSAALSGGMATSVSGRHGGLLLAASFFTLMMALLVARTWVAGPPPSQHPARRSRADLLLAALVVGAAGSGSALGAATGEIDASWPGASLPLVLLALGVLALADRAGVDATGHVRVLSRRLAAADLQSVVVATAAVSAVTFVATSSSPDGLLVAASAADAPAPWIAALTLVSAVLLALLGGVLALGGRRFLPPVPVVVCAAATPVLAVLAALAVRPLVAEASIEWEIIALVVVAFFPVVAATREAAEVRVRTAMEISSVSLGVLTLVLVAARRPTDVLTVALVIAATATAAWAFMPGRARTGWFALALATGASWNALAADGIGTVEAYSAPVALALAVLGAWNVRRGVSSGRRQVLAGVTVLLLPTAFLAPAATQWRSLTVLAALVLVAAGVLVDGELRASRASNSAAAAGPAPARHDVPGLTAWFLALGLGVAVIALAGRAVVLAAAWSAVHGRGRAMPDDQARALLADATAQPGVWIALAALTVSCFCWLLGREWPWSPSAGPRVWGASLVALVVTVPSWSLAAGGALGATGATSTVLALVVLWGAVALLGTPPGLPRVVSRTEFLQRAVPPLVSAYVVVLGLAHATEAPTDLLLTVAGVFVAVVTVRAAVLEPTVSTWVNVSYGAFATLGPVTVALMGEPEGWRVALGVVAASGWLLAGLRLRWQAPVAIGGSVLVVQVVVLAGPLGLATLTGVPGWVVLAVTGLVLLTLGLTYERQITTARATLRRYAELR